MTAAAVEQSAAHIRWRVPASLDVREAGAFLDECLRLKARANGGIRILIDAREATPPDASLRRLAYGRRSEFRDNRVAIVVESTLQEFLVNFMVTAVGHRSTRCFRDEAEGLAWLGAVDA